MLDALVVTGARKGSQHSASNCGYIFSDSRWRIFVVETDRCELYAATSVIVVCFVGCD